MAARKKKIADTPPAIIAIPEVNFKDLGKIMSFADAQSRSAAATNDTERALSALVRTADEIATSAGDIPSDSGSATERERRAKKVDRLNDALEKVRLSVVDLAAA